MKPEEYGEKYSDHFLEQYKLYVEMADRVSQRRDQSNRFYAALLSALAAILVVLARFGLSCEAWAIVFMIDGVIGAALSAIWWVNIKSYRKLNSAKFQIINQMEGQLPVAGYSREWDLLRPKESPPQYFQLTRIEQFVPAVFFLLSLLLLGYAVYLLVS